MKKIIVFGATGTVGRQIVKQALSIGYKVTAFTRKKNSFPNSQDRLTVYVGDVLNVDAVSEAVKGHDAVICALGAGRKGVIRSKGTLNIIKAMETHGLKRLICQSTLGAGDSEVHLDFFWRRIMFGWLLKEAYKDHHLQEDHVFESNLDWTIVRPGAFTNGEKTGQYQHGFPNTPQSLKLKISRADVAHFVLQQIDSNTYLHQTPGLSY